MTVISVLKKMILKLLISNKKTYWKNHNVKLHDTAIVFRETSFNATLGSIVVGKNTCIRGALEVQRSGGSIEVGERCYIGDHTRIWAADSIRIVNNVLIAHNCNVFDNDTHPIDYLERRIDAENIIFKGIREQFSTLKSAPIEIADDVWIGCGSMIMKGVKIGGGPLLLPVV